MKKKVLLTLGLLSILMLGGCQDTEKKLGTLSAPQQVSVQSNDGKSLIIFDEVENAQYYNIYINDMSITVKGDGSGTVEFDASKIINLPQQYTIKVKAGSKKYFDSQFSEECKYSHTGTLASPVVTIDGTILNWNKVDNADFYDISVTSFNPNMENIYTFPVNTFDFSNLLTAKGEYLFRVRAVSENNEYLTSSYSNQIRYSNSITLTTPYNLQTHYDLDSNELLLKFLSSNDVDNFLLNIEGVNYNLSTTSTVFIRNNFRNEYTIKLSSFMSSKGIEFDSSKKVNVCVKAVSTQQYLYSSEFSETISCGKFEVLSKPQLNVSHSSNIATLKIQYANKPYNVANNSQFLSGYALYLNGIKYKTLSKDMTEIELPTSIIGSKGIRVQAISNNNNCYSSNLSDVKYIEAGLPALSGLTITYDAGVVTWNKIDDATAYYVEISNDIFRYQAFVEANADAELKLDISDICEPNNYNVKVIAFKEGFKQSEATKSITYTLQLDDITGVEIREIGDVKYLYFDEVDNAYGYVVYINNLIDDEVFKSSPININKYISDASSYTIQVKAISISDNIIYDSDLSDSVLIQNVKTLSTPSLNIIKKGNKYYLEVSVNDSETASAAGCEIWINYVSIGVQEFKYHCIDITSYFANAGEYSFKAKAIANGSSNVKDSNIASISKTIKKQLDIVQNVIVKELKEESRYILEFDEQTLAAKYLVNIVKAENDSYNVEFEIESGYADITQYVKDNGTYKVYVKAIAMDSGVYEDSATSGNPCRFEKGLTLPSVQNITVTKSGRSIKATWNVVNHAIKYQVNIEYTSPNGQKRVLKSESTTTTNLELGNGVVGKEGVYIIHIKAIGDGEAYENSQESSYSYTYTMETQVDYERNKAFIYGNTYNYHVTTIDELKHLLWYHYLYNDEVWTYNGSLNYNLKIYCVQNIDTMARKYSDTLADEIQDLATKVEKMQHIATRLMAEYPEIAYYTLGDKGMPFCANEQTNVYLFRYKDELQANKLDEVAINEKIFNNKVEEIDSFEKRSSNYVFAIDMLASVDVTTSEQLFMAVQYNRRPNFVGDSIVAQVIYENARFLLRQICSDDMTEYEKATAIYDLLSSRVEYNDNVTTGSPSESISGVMRGNVKDFYLEGILYNPKELSNGLFTSIEDLNGLTAVASGFAKTYALLCAIEGIDCIKVDGTTKNGNSSWNKVYLDINESGTKQWYAIDFVNARTNITYKGQEYQVASHSYYLVTDAYLNNQLSSQIKTWHTRLGVETIDFKYSATTTFDYYTNDIVTCSYKAMSNGSIVTETIVEDHKATTENEFLPLIISARINSGKKHNIVMEIDATGANTDIETLKNNMTSTYIGSANKVMQNKGLGGTYQGDFAVTYIGQIILLCFVPSGV